MGKFDVPPIEPGSSNYVDRDDVYDVKIVGVCDRMKDEEYVKQRAQTGKISHRIDYEVEVMDTPFNRTTPEKETQIGRKARGRFFLTEKAIPYVKGVLEKRLNVVLRGDFFNPTVLIGRAMRVPVTVELNEESGKSYTDIDLLNVLTPPDYLTEYIKTTAYGDTGQDTGTQEWLNRERERAATPVEEAANSTPTNTDDDPFF